MTTINSIRKMATGADSEIFIEACVSFIVNRKHSIKDSAVVARLVFSKVSDRPESFYDKYSDEVIIRNFLFGDYSESRIESILLSKVTV